MTAPIGDVLTAFVPCDQPEIGDTQRVRILAGASDPWSRHQALHITCSALVLHPPSARVLLRWHDRLQRWLHVGGHGEEGEVQPFTVALREATEETGLDDLVSWPDIGTPCLVHIAVVPVPATPHEGAHEHADLRYLLATNKPEEARAETASTPLRWLSMPAALDLVGADNLGITLNRASEMLDWSL